MREQDGSVRIGQVRFFHRVEFDSAGRGDVQAASDKFYGNLVCERIDQATFITIVKVRLSACKQWRSVHYRLWLGLGVLP